MNATAMDATLQPPEEMSASDARLRVDVRGAEPREHVLDDLSFLNYRLADVRIRQFQTLHSLQNYLLLNELLAPGIPMPIVDSDALRVRRAGFVERFADRPFHFVRAATPQVLLDEVDQVV